jgi:hypothetical protein
MTKSITALVAGVLALAGAGNVLAQEEKPANATVHIRDYCDPVTFAAIGCNRSTPPVPSTAAGIITLPGFGAELAAEKSVGAWRFAPRTLAVAEDATLHVQSLGGETHTFTHVKRFGGGFVAGLNAASGNPVPAPECAQVVNGQLVPQPEGPENLFMAPGSTATVTVQEGDVAKFQCCIHPWMRLTVTPQDEHHEEVH